MTSMKEDIRMIDTEAARLADKIKAIASQDVISNDDKHRILEAVLSIRVLLEAKYPPAPTSEDAWVPFEDDDETGLPDDTLIDMKMADGSIAKNRRIENLDYSGAVAYRVVTSVLSTPTKDDKTEEIIADAKAAGFEAVSTNGITVVGTYRELEKFSQLQLQRKTGEAVKIARPDWYQNPTDEQWFEHPADCNLLEGVNVDGQLNVGDEYEVDVCWNGKQKFRVLTLDLEGDVDDVEFVSGDVLYTTPPSPPSSRELLEAAKACEDLAENGHPLIQMWGKYDHQEVADQACLDCAKVIRALLPQEPKEEGKS